MTKKQVLLMINGSQFGHSAGHYYYCKYLKERFVIHYICYDRMLPKINLEGVSVNYVGFDGNKLKRIAAFLRTCILESRKIKPDILFVVYFNISFLLAMLCKKQISVLDIRTGSLSVNTSIRNLNNTLIKFQSRFFKKRIILSESLKVRLNMSAKNILVLPLGSEVYFDGEHNYEQLHLLYVGVFDGRNISETIKGLAIYLTKYPERYEQTLYTIIGFGTPEEENKLHALTKELNLQHIVLFPGRKNYTEFYPYFKEANIGVSYVPITDYYNLQPPTKTFEYILSGLFTIATETFENKRIINTVNGLLCEDKASSFSEGLEKCFDLRHTFKASAIRTTLIDFKWQELVNQKLLPFLTSK